jgi:hypothetical protein
MDGIPLTKVKILCNSPRYDAMPLPLDKLNDVKTYQAFSAPKSKAFKIRSQKLNYVASVQTYMHVDCLTAYHFTTKKYE